MKVVLDTNVVVSACFWRGPPHTCLTEWAQSRFTAFVSPPLLAEYETTFENLLLKYPDRKPVHWVTILTESAELLFPEERIVGGTPDPFDDMVLECAVAADADYLVSEDKRHLLQFVEFRGIPIISPKDFLIRLDDS
jgi:putative PIN family toxin of toxin-antitoxin system